MRNALVALLLLAFQAPFAASPSLDCARSAGEVAALLCKDDALAALDRKLAEVYPAALRELPEAVQTSQRAAQGEWTKRRDACAKAKDIRSCVVARYQDRITELQIRGGLFDAPPPVLYDCGRAGTVTAYFYNGTERPAAVVNTGAGSQDLALQLPSASGARYGTASFVFWIKGDSARLIRPGRADAECTVKR